MGHSSLAFVKNMGSFLSLRQGTKSSTMTFSVKPFG